MKTLVLVLALAFVLGGACLATTFDVYQGWNLVGAPTVPINADPISVFDGINVVGTLTRYDSTNQGGIAYDDIDPTPFGNVLLGDGYWLWCDYPAVVSYDGVADGVPDAGGNKTDMWISLPGNQHDGQDAGGWNLIAQPFDHSTPVQVGSGDGDNIFFTDGTALKTWGEAAAAGWVEGAMSGWAMGGGFSVSADGLGDRAELEAGHGYWLYTYKDNLAMIIPAN